MFKAATATKFSLKVVVSLLFFFTHSLSEVGNETISIL
jgi:hypothetical protein